MESRAADVENALKDLGKKQLVGIINQLLDKYGEDAVTLVLQSRQQKALKSNAVEAPATTSNAVEAPATTSTATAGVEKKGKKEFDMQRYRQRHIAMQVQYEGEHYYGFTSQSGGCEETVEKYLFEALLKLKLITDKQSCNYSRCGRTDRGVSALGQIIALNVRSAIPLELDAALVPKHPCDTVTIEVADHSQDAPNGPQRQANSRKRKAPSEDQASSTGGEPSASTSAAAADKPTKVTTKEVKEMDYCSMMNRLLPEHIRILGWCEVTPDFSSRFSCAYRKYRYFFVKRDLDTAAMNVAAALLQGDHDFRNICKMDVVKISNFRREIYSAAVVPFMPNPDHPEEAIWMLEIRGIAFLWHMVRCIMSLLTMVGQGLEQPEIVSQLLDIDRTPAKPHYQMAPELPLVLHECGFDNMHMWYHPQALFALSTHFENLWERHAVAAARARNALETIKQWGVRVADADEFVAYKVGKRGNGDTARVSVGSSSSSSSGSSSSSSSSSSGSSSSSNSNSSSSSSSGPSSGGEDASTMDVVPSAGTGTGTGTDTDTDTSAAAGADVDEECVWDTVLRALREGHNIRHTDSSVPHRPLGQRHTNDTYEERASHLKGTKRELHERHLSLKEAAGERQGPDFFTKMRAQGSA